MRTRSKDQGRRSPKRGWARKRPLLEQGLVALWLGMSVGVLPAASAEFQFWHGNTGRPAEAIDTACEAFNRSQGEHTIRCIGQGSYESAMQKAIAAYRAGKHPAIVQFFDAGTLDALMSEAMRPVSEVLREARIEADWTDYLPAARNYYATASGTLHAMPFNVSTLLLYANRKLLAKAGISGVPDTWEAFEDALVKLRAAGVTCPYAYRLHPWWFLEQVSAVHGVAIASHNNGYDGLDAEYVFDRGLHVRMMQDLHRWTAAGLAIPDRKLATDHVARAFAAGTCALVLESAGIWGTFKTVPDLDVTAHRIPVYAGHKRHNSLIGGGAIWVMKGFDDETYTGVARFLDFLRQPEQQAWYARETGYLPVTGSGYEAMSDAGPASRDAESAVINDADRDQSFLEMALSSLRAPGTASTRGIRLGFYLRFRNIWIEEMDRAFAGQKTIEAALENAKRRGDRLLRRFERIYAGKSIPQ